MEKYMHFPLMAPLGHEFRVPFAPSYVLVLLDTLFFVNFSDFVESVPPALSGMHNFESCINENNEKGPSRTAI